MLVYSLLDAQWIGIEIHLTNLVNGQATKFATFVLFEANILICFFQVYLSVMATLMISKLGIGPNFKRTLIITVWLLSTTFIVAELLTLAAFTK